MKYFLVQNFQEGIHFFLYFKSPNEILKRDSKNYTKYYKKKKIINSMQFNSAFLLDNTNLVV